MPSYSATAPDGQVITFNHADNLTDDQILSIAQTEYSRLMGATEAPAPQAPPQDVSFIDSLGTGWSQAIGSGAKGIGELFGIESLADWGKEYAEPEQPQMSYEQVEDIPSGVQFVQQESGKVLGGLPAYLGTTWAGAKTGAALMPVPQLKPAAAVVGAIAAPAISYFFGENKMRQEQENEARVARGEAPVQYNDSETLVWSTAQSGLEYTGLRFISKAFPWVNKLLGAEGKQIAEQTAEQLANTARKSRLVGAAKGVGTAVPAEMGVELGQTIMERAAAGLPVYGDEANQEYLAVLAATAAGVAPLGGVGGYAQTVSQKSAARQELAQQEILKEQAEQEAQAQAAAEQAQIDREADRDAQIEQLGFAFGADNVDKSSQLDGAVDYVFAAIDSQEINDANVELESSAADLAAARKALDAARNEAEAQEATDVINAAMARNIAAQAKAMQAMVKDAVAQNDGKRAAALGKRAWALSKRAKSFADSIQDEELRGEMLDNVPVLDLGKPKPEAAAEPEIAPAPEVEAEPEIAAEPEVAAEPETNQYDLDTLEDKYTDADNQFDAQGFRTELAQRIDEALNQGMGATMRINGGQTVVEVVTVDPNTGRVRDAQGREYDLGTLSFDEGNSLEFTMPQEEMPITPSDIPTPTEEATDVQPDIREDDLGGERPRGESDVQPSEPGVAVAGEQLGGPAVRVQTPEDSALADATGATRGDVGTEGVLQPPLEVKAEEKTEEQKQTEKEFKTAVDESNRKNGKRVKAKFTSKIESETWIANGHAIIKIDAGQYEIYPILEDGTTYADYPVDKARKLIDAERIAGRIQREAEQEAEPAVVTYQPKDGVDAEPITETELNQRAQLAVGPSTTSTRQVEQFADKLSEDYGSAAYGYFMGRVNEFIKANQEAKPAVAPEERAQLDEPITDAEKQKAEEAKAEQERIRQAVDDLEGYNELATTELANRLAGVRNRRANKQDRADAEKALDRKKLVERLEKAGKEVNDENIVAEIDETVRKAVRREAEKIERKELGTFGTVRVNKTYEEPELETSIITGDLGRALGVLENSDNLLHKEVAKNARKLMKLGVLKTVSSGLSLQGTSVHGRTETTIVPGDTGIEVNIKINPDFMTDASLFAHELVHAETAIIIHAYNNRARFQGTPIGKLLTPKRINAIKRLEKLLDKTRKQYQKEGLIERTADGTAWQPTSKLRTDYYSDMFYPLKDIEEFLAEGMANAEFQQYLFDMKMGPQTLWTKFVDTLADLLGYRKGNAFYELVQAHNDIVGNVKDQAPLAVNIFGQVGSQVTRNVESPTGKFIALPEPGPNGEFLQPEGAKQFFLGGVYLDGRVKEAIGWVDPMAFIRATTGNEQAAQSVIEEAAEFQNELLANAAQGDNMYLYISDTASGNRIIAHEGRHRLAALAAAGYKKVPMLFRDADFNYDSSTTGFRGLKGKTQTFFGEQRENGVGDELTVENLIPVQSGTKKEIFDTFFQKPVEVEQETIGKNREDAENIQFVDGVLDAAQRPEFKPEKKSVVDSMTAPFKNEDGSAKTKKDIQRDGRKWMDTIATRFFSADASVQRAIRDAIRKLTDVEAEIVGTLLNTSTSQAYHAEAVASQVLEKGNAVYDENLHKWRVEESEYNYPNLIRKIQAMAEKHGVPVTKMETLAHAYLEAKRIRAIKNRQIATLNTIERLEKGTAADKRKAKKLRKHYSDRFIHMTDAQMDAAIDAVNKFPELEDIANTWEGMRQNVVNIMVTSGTLDQETADIWMDNSAYVPFQRATQIESGEGLRDYVGGLVGKPDLKKFKGTDRPVNHLFDNMVRWTEHYVEIAVRNKTAGNIVTAMEKLGLAEQRDPEVNEKKQRVSVYMDGKPTTYVVADPLMVEAFTSMEAAGMPMLGWASKFTNLLRKSVVLNPIFSIGQLTQDAVGAMFASGLPPSQSIQLPFRIISQFVKTLTGTSKAHKDLKLMGAAGVRDYSAATVRNEIENYIAEVEPHRKGTWEKTKRFFEDFSMASDNAVRQAVYELSLEQGLSKAEAVERAFEIINFRRKGSHPAIQAAVRYIPFFNAYLQALNVQGKVLAGEGISPRAQRNRTAFYQNMGMVMAFTAYYTLMNSGDDDYEQMNPALRDRMLHIGGGFGVPLRTDLFLLPKILVEHGIRMATDAETEDGRVFWNSMRDGIANAFLSPTVVPQIFKPTVELMLDRSFYTGRNIVPLYLSSLAPYEQYNEYTSELSKLIGGSINVSPAKLDYWLRGTFGSAGAAVLWASNAIDTSVNVRPDRSITDAVATFPGMSRFMNKEFGSGYRDLLFEGNRQVEQTWKTYNSLVANKPHDVVDFLSDDKNVNNLAVRDAFKQLADEVRDIRKQKRKISESALIDAETKKEAIKLLEEREQSILKNMPLKDLRSQVTFESFFN